MLRVLMDTVSQTMKRIIADRKKATPGMICVLHPYGKDLSLNPHARVLATEGGLTKRNEWVKVNFFELTNSIPLRYYPDPHVVVASKMKHEPLENVSVVGSLCSAADVLGRDRKLPRLERGDLVAILDVGGYAESSFGQHNAFPKPATILIRGREVDIVRRRETLQDVISRDRIPHWLY